MATNPRTHLPSTDLKVDKELQSVDGAPVADLVRYWGVTDTSRTRPNQPPTSTDPATTRPASRPERTPSTPPTPHDNPPLTSANVLNVRSHLNVGRPPAPGAAAPGVGVSPGVGVITAFIAGQITATWTDPPAGSERPEPILIRRRPGATDDRPGFGDRRARTPLSCALAPIGGPEPPVADPPGGSATASEIRSRTGRPGLGGARRATST